MMQNSKYRGMLENKPISHYITIIAFLILSLVTTFIITRYGNDAGYLLIIVILGSSVSLCCILFPLFGMYVTLAMSFFVWDLSRVIGGDIGLSSLVDFLTLASFLGIVLKKILRKEFFWKNCNHPILYIYLIYALYTLLQLFNPNVENISGVVLIIRKFIVLLLFFYCLIQSFNSVKEIERFFKIYLSLAFLTALYACYQEWFGMPQYQLNFIMSDPLLMQLYQLDNGEYRKFSFLGNPKSYGLLMAASALIPIVFLVNIKMKFKRKFLLFTCIAILLIGMSYSGTRTANFMLVLGIVLYILMTITNKKTLFFACISILLFLFILYAPIYGNVTINRIRSTFELSTDASLEVRDINRKNIQPYIHSHPIGGGLGSTGVLNIKNNPNHPLSGFPTDSGYLQTALELGWIGLLIQCTVYFLVMQQGIRAYYRNRNKKYRTLILAALPCLFSYMVAQYAQVSIGDFPGIFLIYALITIIIRLPQIEKENLEKLKTDNV